MDKLYPLMFVPEFKEKIWGGRRLEAYCPGSPGMPPGPIGEAWVLSAHPSGPTVVANGALAGDTIPELIAQYGAALMGRSWAASRPEQGYGAGAVRQAEFPLLIKLLDSNDDLSVQVHPSCGYSGLKPGEAGKAEMWLVLHAEPGAKIVYGLAPGVTREEFETAVRTGHVMQCLRQAQVAAGDVIPVPPGTIHALGAGIVVAEVQQSSDTVYRVWDYGRIGLDGRPRDLHIKQALEVTNYSVPPAVFRLEPPAPNSAVHMSSYAGLDVWSTRCSEGAGAWRRAGSSSSFRAVLVLDGAGLLDYSDGQIRLGPGASLLIPAECPEYSLSGDLSMLEVTLS